MEKRFWIFLAVAFVVLYGTMLLFPSPQQPKTRAGDSVAVRDTAHRAVEPSSVATPAPVLATAARVDTTVVSNARVDTIVVHTSNATYRMSTRGAAPIGARMDEFRAYSKGDGKVELARSGSPLLSYAVVSERRDTISLDRTVFSVDSSARGAGGLPILRFRGALGADTAMISYTFSPDSYLVRVSGSVRSTGSASGAPRVLVVSLPSWFRSSEADSAEDDRHLAFVVKTMRDDPESIDFSKLDSTVARVQNGPLSWVASKNKYFLVAMMSDTARSPFAGAVFEGVPRPAKTMAVRASGRVIQQLPADGAFAFTLYIGPQEWRRLLALGREMQNVNPHGWIFRPIVQPFITLLMRLLLWAHDISRINYGWLVVIFGVAIRLLLWPLNQSAMRAQLKLQRIQPELQVIQKKFKNTPEKLNAEMMKLYREHEMSPFSPLAGCVPMLIPMPVLYALYFVFQDTIEFRGVSFLWMADISQRDPYYILPILMAVSMFFLSWIGLRASPQNSQAKVMAYTMPVVMGVFFYRLAAGLNLYYAVQNLAAIPQQWLIARERAKAGVPATSAGPAGARAT
ncbi:MAG TPA: membrane protein insertase YidC [Gemmatimonadaceae bacterium]|nr:membrane protein insertase YidC [Gemmatimonadaceae bacterium]